MPIAFVIPIERSALSQPTPVQLEFCKREFISTYSLAQRSALSNGNLVTLLNTESWRNVRSQVLMSLLVSGVFGDEVEVLAADDDGTVHLGGDDGAGQDTATDRDHSGEGALLVC